MQTFILDQATYIKDKKIIEIFLWQEGQSFSLHLIRWASHYFPIEDAGRQDFTHMIAQPAINKDLKDRKTTRGTPYRNLIIFYVLAVHQRM